MPPIIDAKAAPKRKNTDKEKYFASLGSCRSVTEGRLVIAYVSGGLDATFQFRRCAPVQAVRLLYRKSMVTCLTVGNVLLERNDRRSKRSGI
jgi:hypothetical protein